MTDDVITIIDLGIGNIGSINNMISKIGGSSIISNDPKEIEKSKKIILPGVGSFDKAMYRINELKLFDVLIAKALVDKIPFFGICLGMQLLTKSSHEGKEKGLGLIEAKTISFKNEFEKLSIDLRVPHMGWNNTFIQNDSIFTENLEKTNKYYFVHSYFVRCMDSENISMSTDYGISFHSAIKKDNIFGSQFHPEKSHKFGMNLLKNFINI